MHVPWVIVYKWLLQTQKYNKRPCSDVIKANMTFRHWCLMCTFLTLTLSVVRPEHKGYWRHSQNERHCSVTVTAHETRHFGVTVSTHDILAWQSRDTTFWRDDQKIWRHMMLARARIDVESPFYAGDVRHRTWIGTVSKPLYLSNYCSKNCIIK